MQFGRLWRIILGLAGPCVWALCAFLSVVKSRLPGWQSIKPAFRFPLKWPRWGHNMFAVSPMLWFAVVGWLFAAGTYGVMKVQEARHISASYAEGKRVGAAEVA